MRLVIRSGGLGDAVLTLPVFAALRRQYPDDDLHLLGSRYPCDIGLLAGCVSTAVSLDMPGFHTLYGDTPGGDVRDFMSRYDAVYWFTSAPADRCHTLLRECGVDLCRVLDPRPPAVPVRHAAEHLLDILEFPVGPPVLPSLDQSAVHDRIGSGNRRGLVIQPGSGGTAKNWPLERFAAVAEVFGPDVTVVLGPAERERGIDVARFPANTRVVSPADVNNLVRLIEGAAAYLGNDSGAGHIAAFAGTPAVVLFGPTDPAVWRPLGADTTVIRAPGGCMADIGVEEVLAALSRYDGLPRRPRGGGTVA